VLVLLTDGKVNNGEEIQTPSRELKDAGVILRLEREQTTTKLS